MSETAKQILSFLSEQPGAEDRIQYNYSKDSKKKSFEVRAIDELAKLGCIVKLATAIGFCVCRVTSYGFSVADD